MRFVDADFQRKNEEAREAQHTWGHTLPKQFFADNMRNLVERRNKYEKKLCCYVHFYRIKKEPGKKDNARIM